MPSQCAPHRAAGTCLVDRDAHFRPDLQPRSDSDLGRLLGLRSAPGPQYRAVRNGLLVQLAIGWTSENRWLAYSRSRNTYVASRFYFGPAFSYARTLDVVHELEGAGLVAHERVRPSSSAGRRSRLRLSPDLRPSEIIGGLDELRQADVRSIRLKDCQKNLIVYRDTELTRLASKDICAQNEAIASLAIEFAAPGWRRDPLGLYHSEAGAVVNPLRRRLYRVFNDGSWRLGGRWYSGWWQNLPSEARRQLRIDHEPVLEYDYPYLHPRLLAAGLGVRLDGDPYDVPGVARGLAKTAWNTAVNAASPAAARQAISAELRAWNLPSSFAEVDKILEGLARRTPGFARTWGSGLGLRLQRLDADICGDVQRTLRSRGIVALSVHDSFLVKASASQALLGAMADALDRAVRKVRNGLA